jgi:Protein of unknown function (DUF3738)
VRLVDASSGGGALSDALQKLGLKLEARKAQIDVVVIDDALKTPQQIDVYFTSWTFSKTSRASASLSSAEAIGEALLSKIIDTTNQPD